ncbi:porin [Octadecabacter sp. CECT 8868]|uniref:porin n=1 Tax=Octadecabacter algicola TaxID=2909342 RepID=UPI001F272746|nr:porin [Octadecabacter algicola]MCF2906230.1 porin [Octadecabacter algicola]
MKRILLASTAIVAFAGAAAAEVTFSGAVELGYNTDDTMDGVFSAEDNNEGFYGTVDLGVGFSQELDNGITAAVEFDIEFDEGIAGDLSFDDALLSLSSDTAAMYFGVTSFAAESLWSSAGDMEADGFSEASDEIVLKGTMTYGNVEAALSYALTADDGTSVSDLGDDDMDQMSLGLVGTFGNFTVGAAYQEAASSIDETMGNGDFVTDEVFGIFASTSFSGADVTVAYAQEEAESSMGVKVAYPFGPVTATAYYVVEDSDAGDVDDNWGINLAYENGPAAVSFDYQDDQGTAKMGLEGSYDIGNGLVAYAGYLTQDDTDDRYYVAGGYDLGGGAALLVSYAIDDDDVDEDEIGAGDYQRGTTVELTFEF